MVFETLVFSPFNQLTRLIARENFIILSRRESNKSHRLRLLENRALGRIFGPKREKVAEGWRRLHNEELYNLYCLSGIVKMIKSRRMRWAGHVARMRGM
jgi:hypothetical protein